MLPVNTSKTNSCLACCTAVHLQEQWGYKTWDELERRLRKKPHRPASHLTTNALEQIPAASFQNLAIYQTHFRWGLVVATQKTSFWDWIFDHLSVKLTFYQETDPIMAWFQRFLWPLHNVIRGIEEILSRSYQVSCYITTRWHKQNMRQTMCGADILAGDGVKDVFTLKLFCDDNVNILILTAFRHQEPCHTRLCLLTCAVRCEMK